MTTKERYAVIDPGHSRRIAIPLSVLHQVVIVDRTFRTTGDKVALSERQEFELLIVDEIPAAQPVVDEPKDGGEPL